MRSRPQFLGYWAEAAESKLEAAKLGPPPSRDVALQAATQSLKAHLPDYDSAKIGFGDIEPGFYARGAGSSSQRFAWMLTGFVDAKNVQGIYDGAKPYNFFFIGARLVATAFPDAVWTGRGYRYPYTITESEGGGLTAVQAGLRPVTEPPRL